DGALFGSAGASPSRAAASPSHQPPGASPRFEASNADSRSTEPDASACRLMKVETGASPRFDGSDAGAVLTKPDASACRLPGGGAGAPDGALFGSAGASPSRALCMSSHQPPGA